MSSSTFTSPPRQVPDVEKMLAFLGQQDNYLEIMPPTIFFDGVCNLCNGWVRFVIRRDPKKVFRFSPLQNASNGLTTIILKDGQKTFEKSTAVLRITRRLRFPWPLFFVLIVFPRPIRDAVYDFISKRRYQWFGRRDQCMIPTEDVKDRFLSVHPDR